jgi:hypothetical protein
MKGVNKMKESKIQKAARIAKGMGYTHIYSIVKSVYVTTYVHVNDIDHVIDHGWTPAPNSGAAWHGRLGIPIKELPEKSISRQAAFKLVN